MQSRTSPSVSSKETTFVDGKQTKAVEQKLPSQHVIYLFFSPPVKVEFINRQQVSKIEVREDKRIGKQVDSKSIALHGVAGSSPVSSALGTAVTGGAFFVEQDKSGKNKKLLRNVTRFTP